MAVEEATTSCSIQPTKGSSWRPLASHSLDRQLLVLCLQIATANTVTAHSFQSPVHREHSSLFLISFLKYGNIKNNLFLTYNGEVIIINLINLLYVSTWFTSAAKIKSKFLLLRSQTEKNAFLNVSLDKLQKLTGTKLYASYLL